MPRDSLSQGPRRHWPLDAAKSDQRTNPRGSSGVLLRSVEMADVGHTVLFSADQVKDRVSGLAAEIRRAYPADTTLHLVAILKGGFVFLADLARVLDRPVTIDFVAVSSYGAATRSTGAVRLRQDLHLPVRDRDVLVVEDIIDTGETLAWILKHLRAGGPRSLRTVVLLDKPSRRKLDIQADYVGFTIPDRFVVGYGLDHDEQLRHLPYVAVLGGSSTDTSTNVSCQTTRGASG